MLTGEVAIQASVQTNTTPPRTSIARPRRCDDSFVLILDRGPSTRDVIREQLHVAKAFPDWKPQPA